MTKSPTITVAFTAMHNINMCYFEKMSALQEDYILFYPQIAPELGMEEEMAGTLTIEGTPTLKTNEGVTVEAADIDSGIDFGHPELFMAFPNKDAKGNDVISGATDFITVTVKYKERKEASVFKWELPLEKTNLMYRAEGWVMAKQEDKKTYCED